MFLFQANIDLIRFYISLGYTFHIAADIGIPAAFAFDHIEDAMIQADEVDSQYLQFEGGLSITSTILKYYCFNFKFFC
jgi:oligosaccharyltransferase complex subunit delta (ribophorin II)